MIKTKIALLFCFTSLSLFGFRLPVPLQLLVHEADIIVIGEIESVPKITVADKWNNRIRMLKSPVKINYLLKGNPDVGNLICEFREDRLLRENKPYIIFAKFNKKKSQYDVSFFTTVKATYTIPLEISSSKSLDTHKNHGYFVGPVIFDHKMFLMTIIGLVSLEDKNYNQKEKIKMLKLDASEANEKADAKPDKKASNK